MTDNLVVYRVSSCIHGRVSHTENPTGTRQVCSPETVLRKGRREKEREEVKEVAKEKNEGKNEGKNEELEFCQLKS